MANSKGSCVENQERRFKGNGGCLVRKDPGCQAEMSNFIWKIVQKHKDIEEPDHTMCCQDAEQLKLSFVAGGNLKNGPTTLENSVFASDTDTDHMPQPFHSKVFE